MKYFHDIFTLNLIDRLSGSAVRGQKQYNRDALASRLLHNYAPSNCNVVPLKYSNASGSATPSFCVDKFIDGNIFSHVIVNMKGAATSVENMLDTIFSSFNFVSLNFFENDLGIYSVVIRLTSIGFYVYKNNPELFQFGVPNYNGFIPLSYKLSPAQWAGIVTKRPNDLTGYPEYCKKRENIIDSPQLLETELGVGNTPNLNYPHVYEFNNAFHAESIHALFTLLFEDAKE